MLGHANQSSQGRLCLRFLPICQTARPVSGQTNRAESLANEAAVANRAGAIAWLERRHGRPLAIILRDVIVQFGLLFGLMTFYTWFRKTFFQQPPDEAYANALDLIDLQARLRLPVERIELPLQQWAIDAGIIDFFNTYYRQFKPSLYLAAMLALVLAPAGYRRVRRIFLLTTVIAFPMYALFPLAPPRLMTEFGFPFVDTVAIAKGISSTAQGASSANLYAAMPSMHIGWTTIAALWLAAALPWRRLGAGLGLVHLALMAATVMITGNHYWLDIAGGLVAVALACLIAWRLPEQIPWPWQRSTSEPERVREVPSGT